MSSKNYLYHVLSLYRQYLHLFSHYWFWRDEYLLNLLRKYITVTIIVSRWFFRTAYRFFGLFPTATFIHTSLFLFNPDVGASSWYVCQLTIYWLTTIHFGTCSISTINHLHRGEYLFKYVLKTWRWYRKKRDFWTIEISSGASPQQVLWWWIALGNRTPSSQSVLEARLSRYSLFRCVLNPNVKLVTFGYI